MCVHCVRGTRVLHRFRTLNIGGLRDTTAARDGVRLWMQRVQWINTGQLIEPYICDRCISPTRHSRLVFFRVSFEIENALNCGVKWECCGHENEKSVWGWPVPCCWAVATLSFYQFPRIIIIAIKYIYPKTHQKRWWAENLCESFALVSMMRLVHVCVALRWMCGENIKKRMHTGYTVHATRDFVDKIVIYIVISVCNVHGLGYACVQWAKVFDLISVGTCYSCDTYFWDGKLRKTKK